MNGDLVAKNLSLETQVAKASSLQRKLTEAKEVNTAVVSSSIDFKINVGNDRAKYLVMCRSFVLQN